MKYTLSILITILWASLLQAQTNVTTNEIEDHIRFLASEEMKGRKPGTPEDKLIIQYLKQDFTQAGLDISRNNAVQEFDIVAGISVTDATQASVQAQQLSLNQDYTPVSFSANATLEAPVIIMGYGFDIDKKDIQRQDYKNVDVKGKWVLIFRGAPQQMQELDPYANLRSKVITAQSKGAAGVLVVSPTHLEEEDILMPLFYDKVAAKANIPVLSITRQTANLIISMADQEKTLPTIEHIEKDLEISETPYYFDLSTTFKVEIILEQDIITTANVFAVVPGTDNKLKEEFIVVGAHYDHLGMGGAWSGSRMPDTSAVHYGADDNASGVALVLELAEYFARHPLKRSMLFIAFGAEEMGLLGSSHFIKDPPIDKEHIACMINFDMVGRLNSCGNNLNISGTGTATQFDSILDIHSKPASFQLSRNKDGYGASDHAMFYAQEIPVLAFFTGIHTDYHTPFDQVDKIDFEGSKAVADFALAIIQSIDQLNENPSYVSTGAAPQKNGHSRRFKVTLGIIPDFADNGGKGLGVSGVKKGEPADRGGMKQGDIITAINGNPITNIYDYMHWLAKLNPGETAIVEVEREGKRSVLLIQL